MRRVALLAAVVSVLATPSASFAVLFLTTSRSPAGISGFDRVNLVLGEASSPTLSLATLSVDIVIGDVPLPSIGATGPLSFHVPDLGSPIVHPRLTQQLNDGPMYGSIRTFGGFSSDLGATSVATPAPASNKSAYRAGLARISIQSFFVGSPFTAPTADFGSGLIVGSAVVPTGTPVRFFGDVSPTMNPADRQPFNKPDILPPPTHEFGQGLLLSNADARQSLATTGDNPTIYTIMVDFGHDSGVPATFAIDTNMTNGGSIASIGPSPDGVTVYAEGDVLYGTVERDVRRSWDIPLLGSGPARDTAILRSVYIPEPLSLGIFAGLGVVVARRRR